MTFIGFNVVRAIGSSNYLYTKLSAGAIKENKGSFRSAEAWPVLSLGLMSGQQMARGMLCILASLALSPSAHAAADSEIGIAKEVSAAPSLQPDGTFTLQYTIRVTNPNSFAVENVQVVDDLSSVFVPAPASINSATVSSSDFTVSHSGVSDTSLLDGTDTLAAGATGTITIDVVLDAAGEIGPYFNTADAEGDSVCVVGTATTGGLAINNWSTDNNNVPGTTVPLSTHFTGPLDANGFRTRAGTPTVTGFTTSPTNLPLTTPGSSTGEIVRADGWVSAPCVSGGTSWELRFRMGRSVATYLGALKSDAAPAAADIVTGGGIDGFEQTLALFQANIVSTSSVFTGTLGIPVGMTLQIDDRGSAFTMTIQERINGGTWTAVPIGRIWSAKPTGQEVGGRALSDTSDNGDNPDPTDINGTGGVDDPTPVLLPLVADLSITKTNTPGVNGNVDQASDTVTSGSVTTYTLTVSNNGPSSIAGAVVTDTPIAGIACPAANVVSISGDGIPVGSFTVADLTGTGIALGTLDDGQSAVVTFDCVVL